MQLGSVGVMSVKGRSPSGFEGKRAVGIDARVASHHLLLALSHHTHLSLSLSLSFTLSAVVSLSLSLSCSCSGDTSSLNLSWVLPLFFYETKSDVLGVNTSLLRSSTMNITKGGAHLDSMWNDVTGYGIHGEVNKSGGQTLEVYMHLTKSA
jgi:hypothetical protein